MHPETILAESKSNFQIAFSKLEAHQKRALTAVYAFCRVVDDIVDEIQDEQKVTDLLAQWESCVLQKQHLDNPLADELMWSMDHFSIPSDHFTWLIEGVRQDITKKRYATWEELNEYCDAVATSVGLMCLQVFGIQTQHQQPYAMHTGRALQLTNIARDVFADADLHRVYIPQSHLEAFNLTDQDIIDKKYNPQFRKMFLAFLEKAQDYYESSDQDAEFLNQKKLWPAQVMKKVYQAICQKMQKHPHKIQNGKVSISSLQKFWISQSVYIRSRI